MQWATHPTFLSFFLSFSFKATRERGGGFAAAATFGGVGLTAFFGIDGSSNRLGLRELTGSAFYDGTSEANNSMVSDYNNITAEAEALAANPMGAGAPRLKTSMAPQDGSSGQPKSATQGAAAGQEMNDTPPVPNGSMTNLGGSSGQPNPVDSPTQGVAPGQETNDTPPVQDDFSPDHICRNGCKCLKSQKSANTWLKMVPPYRVAHPSENPCLDLPEGSPCTSSIGEARHCYCIGTRSPGACTGARS